MKFKDRRANFDIHFLSKLKDMSKSLPTKAEATATHNLTPRVLSTAEVIIAEDLRRKARNTQYGPTASSMTPELRDKAIQAYIFSKPANPTPEELKNLTGMKPITSEQPSLVWTTIPWYTALFHRLTGGEVVSKQENGKTYWGRYE